jgi:hypothetical protein
MVLIPAVTPGGVLDDAIIEQWAGVECELGHRVKILPNSRFLGLPAICISEKQPLFPA